MTTVFPYRPPTAWASTVYGARTQLDLVFGATTISSVLSPAQLKRLTLAPFKSRANRGLFEADDSRYRPGDFALNLESGRLLVYVTVASPLRLQAICLLVSLIHQLPLLSRYTTESSRNGIEWFMTINWTWRTRVDFSAVSRYLPRCLWATLSALPAELFGCVRRRLFRRQGDSLF